MDNNKEILILERCFDLIEEILPQVISPTEEETRNKIKEVVNKNLGDTNDPIERAALVEAANKLSRLTFEELIEISKLGEEQSEQEESFSDINTPLRKKIMESEPGDIFVMRNEIGDINTYEMQLRFIYGEDDIYVLLINLTEEDMKNTHMAKFYLFEYGENIEEDKITLITDKQLNDELSKFVYINFYSDGE